MKLMCVCIPMAVACLAAPAWAAVTIDGTIDPAYGTALAVQTIETGFGNQTNPTGIGSGGELDAAYATIEGGRLFVMLTGNIENNFNKVSVFIDSKAGGENILSSAPAYDFENISQNFGGLTFDSGFQADYHLYARWGSFSGNVFTVDIVDRNGGASTTVEGNGANSTTGGGTAIQTGVVNPGDLGLGSTGVGEVRNLTPFLTSPLNFGFNNTNTAGVGGSGGSAANTAAALAVTTGFEFSIALADIGNPGPGDDIKLHAVYGNSNNNFHSNQTLGGLPIGTNNLGNPANIDFNNSAGDQFFTITVPNLLGDLNADGFVGVDDLNIVLLNWNQTVTPGDLSAGDPTGEGFVGVDDLNVVLLNWNNGTPPSDSANIPEPTGLTLLALGASALLRRH